MTFKEQLHIGSDPGNKKEKENYLMMVKILSQFEE
jgi:hypothetical protein